ncbi:MAG: FeoA family protein [Oscillospiraceae bacterium]
MTLRQATDGREYTVRSINIEDDELQSFLFSLGCYSGEKITVVSHLRGSCVIAVKNGRYSIDNQLAEAIKVIA